MECPRYVPVNDKQVKQKQIKHEKVLGLNVDTEKTAHKISIWASDTSC